MNFKKFLAVATLVAIPLTVFAGVRVYNTSGTLLGVWTEIQCGTNVTCAVSSGKLNIAADSAALSLASGEAITNAVDDTVEVKSNDEATTFRVEGFEAKGAILELAADDGDDTADVYTLKADTSNVFTIMNGATDLATLTTAGDWVFKGTTPYLTVGDAGAEDAGVAFDGNAQDYHISLDDSTDDLVIGLGLAAGTTDAIRIDENQDVTIVQGLIGLGTDELVGFLQNQIASSTTTLTAAQCGSTIVSNSADVMTLPEASTVLGCRYTFVCGTADDLDVNPNDGTDQIGPALNSVAGGTGSAITPSAGDAIRCTDIGSSITIEAVGADLWAPIGVGNGAWTDVN